MHKAKGGNLEKMTSIYIAESMMMFGSSMQAELATKLGFEVSDLGIHARDHDCEGGV